jgi:hypothetical protein
MLVAAPSLDASVTPLSNKRVLAVLGRQSLPSLAEATLIPSIIFYLCLVHIGAGAAMIAVLSWSYGAVLRRWVSGHRIPAILMLAVLGLTVRTVLGLMSGSFIYFIQPVITTLVLAAVFLGSLCCGRPIIGHLAHDFCPLSSDIAGRPAITRLFTGQTLLWAGVHLLTAATTFGLLVSVETATFVLLKSVVSLTITISAIVVTVSWSIRTARSEHLVMARFVTDRAAPTGATLATQTMLDESPSVNGFANATT